MWAYTFTDFTNFGSGGNAVTPWPTTPNKGFAEVPVSSTPPRGKDDFNAIDFSLWREIGKDFLVTSNINHWISCRPESGSLVEWTDGSIDCKNIKNVSSRCPGNCPTKIRLLSSYAICRLYDAAPPYTPTGYRGHFYYFEGHMKYPPFHDPCSSGSLTPGVINPVETPYGNLYIR